MNEHRYARGWAHISRAGHPTFRMSVASFGVRGLAAGTRRVRLLRDDLSGRIRLAAPLESPIQSRHTYRSHTCTAEGLAQVAHWPAGRGGSGLPHRERHLRRHQMLDLREPIFPHRPLRHEGIQKGGLTGRSCRQPSP